MRMVKVRHGITIVNLLVVLSLITSMFPFPVHAETGRPTPLMKNDSIKPLPIAGGTKLYPSLSISSPESQSSTQLIPSALIPATSTTTSTNTTTLTYAPVATAITGSKAQSTAYSSYTPTPTATPTLYVNPRTNVSPSPNIHEQTDVGLTSPIFDQSIPSRVLEQIAQGVHPTNEWVNLYGLRVFIDGQPAPVGSLVRAYNPRGIVAGEFAVSQNGIYGLMPVYRDDPNTPQDEGLLPGEVISFTINDLEATALGPDSNIWTANGDLKHVDLAVGQAPPSSQAHRLFLPLISSGITSHSSVSSASVSGTSVFISLKSGWNLISFPIMPANPQPAIVLSSIAGLFTGVTRWGSTGLNN